MVNFEDSVNNVYKKSEKFVNIQKLKLKIASLKGDVENKYAELGRYEYQRSVKGAEDEEYRDSIIADIRQLKQEIVAVKKKLAELRGGKVCPACSAINPEESNYCSKCGEAL